MFADFNGDGQLDVSIGDHGYDAPPFPGAQNRLFLSNGNGTWREAGDNLPAISAPVSPEELTGTLDKLLARSPRVT